MSGESKGLLRQGAWMVAATTSGGVAMMLVNTLVSKRCGGEIGRAHV